MRENLDVVSFFIVSKLCETTHSVSFFMSIKEARAPWALLFGLVALVTSSV